MSTVLFFYQGATLTSEILGPTKRSFFAHGRDAFAEIVHLPRTSSTTLLGVDRLGSIITAAPTTQRYGPYGYDRATLPSRLTVLGFTGARRGPTEGDYLLGNGYRTYKSWLMRFNSPDVMSPFLEGGINAYAYCQGDPINFADPTGKIKKKMFERYKLLQRQQQQRSSAIQHAPGTRRTPHNPSPSIPASSPPATGSSANAMPGSSSQMTQGITEPITPSKSLKWAMTASRFKDENARAERVKEVVKALNIPPPRAFRHAQPHAPHPQDVLKAELEETKTIVLQQMDQPWSSTPRGYVGRNTRPEYLRGIIEKVRKAL